MAVGGKLLHIVAAKRQVGLDRCRAVLIECDDLNQSVCGNGGAADADDFLGGIQPEGDVLQLAVCADAEQLIRFKGFHKADFRRLTLVDKGGRRFGDGNILTGVDQFNRMRLAVQHHTMRCGNLPYLIFAEIEFTALGNAVFIGGNRVHDLALLISDSAVRRSNVLSGDDLIDRTGKSTLFILRLIDGRQFLAALVLAAGHGNAEEHLAGLFHRDGALLRHIGLIHFYHCNPAFLGSVFLRDIKVHGRRVKDIAVGSLHLPQRIARTEVQLLRRNQCAVCVGIECVDARRRGIGVGHRHKVAGRVIDLEARPGIGDALAGFCVHLHHLDIAFKGRVVDEVAVGSAVLCNEHIKVGHLLAALPAGYLMHGIDAIGQFLSLCKAIFVTGEIVALGGFGVFI